MKLHRVIVAWGAWRDLRVSTGKDGSKREALGVIAHISSFSLFFLNLSVIGVFMATSVFPDIRPARVIHLRYEASLAIACFNVSY